MFIQVLINTITGIGKDIYIYMHNRELDERIHSKILTVVTSEYIIEL